MTVYTDNPFGGMRNPAPYGGGIAGGLMNRPPPFMPQMPRRMPGGPSKGGTTSIPMRRPPMQRPGGPGKARTGGGFMRRGRGRPMPGGPGKGRGQMQQPMPARPSFGQLMTQGPMNMPRPTPTPRFDISQDQRPGGSGVSPPSSISSSPFMIQQGLGQTGQFGQLANNRPVPPLDFGQRRPQGPMNMPPPFMPQLSGFDSRVGDGMTPDMSSITQGFTQGPTSMPNSPFMMQQGGMGFYGGGITDLY